MENGVTDRLWDKDVQEFIEACKHERLSDIALGFSGAGSEFLSVSAQYRTRRGRLVPIGYRWVKTEKWGTVAEVYVGTASAPASHEAKGFFRVARKARLWWERKQVAYALLAVTTLYFKAHAVRNRLQLEQLESLKNDQDFTAAMLKGRLNDDLDIAVRREEIDKARHLALQTLNDLAHLYGAHSGGSAG